MSEAGRRMERRCVVSRGEPGRDGEVLVWPAEGGWVLPRLDGDERRAADVGEVVRAARERLGLDAWVLRCLGDGPAGAGGIRRQAFAVEATGGAPSGRWMRRADLDEAVLQDPEDRRVVAVWRAGLAHPSPDRPAWERVGWRGRMLAGVGALLARRGLGDVVEVEQVRLWEYSHVIRLRAGAGEYFVKARPPAGRPELALTARLAAAHPHAAPDVLAVEPDEPWMLMRRTPGPTLDAVTDPAAWEGAARTLAELQIAWVPRRAELVALGCPERPVHELVDEIDPLLADDAAVQPDHPEALTGEERARLARAASDVRARCVELAGLGVPASLEHGDCWGANVVVSPDGPVLLDWEDAAVAHPFLSLFLLALSVDDDSRLADKADARARVEAAYLRCWRERGPLAGWPAARLDRALALTRVVAPLHYAALFRRGVGQIETSWEVRFFCPYFLHLLLRALEA